MRCSLSVSVSSLLLIPEEKTRQDAVRRAKTEIRFYFICFSFWKCPVAASFFIILRQNGRWKPCAVRVWARFLREGPDEWINCHWPAAKAGAAPRQVVWGVNPWQTQFALLCFMTLQLSGGVSKRLASERRREKKGWRKNKEGKQSPIRTSVQGGKQTNKQKNPVNLFPSLCIHQVNN